MRIAVIGAGWFGAHLAVSLIYDGHEVTVFERGSSLFGGASGSNQNRLHLGYHYPRSQRTRDEIRVTHQRFIDTYPTKKVNDNLFAISTKSWIDLPSYTKIMRGDRLPVEIELAKRYGITNVESDVVLYTDERVIDTEAAKASFAEKLSGHIVFNVPIPRIDKSNEYDAVIDCTSGELNPNQGIYFEPAVMAEYDGPEAHFALTVMDGPFPCLYPTATPGRWRVSHVLHTARGAFSEAAEAADLLKKLDSVEVTNEMTMAMIEYYPAFVDLFKPRWQLIKAVRTKLKNNNASRECVLHAEHNVLRVFSGKICSVFLVEDQVKKWLLTL